MGLEYRFCRVPLLDGDKSEGYFVVFLTACSGINGFFHFQPTATRTFSTHTPSTPPRAPSTPYPPLPLPPLPPPLHPVLIRSPHPYCPLHPLAHHSRVCRGAITLRLISFNVKPWIAVTVTLLSLFLLLSFLPFLSFLSGDNSHDMARGRHSTGADYRRSSRRGSGKFSKERVVALKILAGLELTYFSARSRSSTLYLCYDMFKTGHC